METKQTYVTQFRRVALAKLPSIPVFSQPSQRMIPVYLASDPLPYFVNTRNCIDPQTGRQNIF
jgi:hypothetical protein